MLQLYTSFRIFEKLLYMATSCIIISIKDVSIVLNKSYQQAFRIHQGVRDALGKQKKQVLTKAEFANYMGIPLQEIEAALK